MKKIEEQMLSAIRRGINWRKSNTEVRSHNGLSEVYLHGHHIVTVNRETGQLWMCTAGWNTPTTRSRLNAIGSRYGAEVRQRHFILYVNGAKWAYHNLVVEVFPHHIDYCNSFPSMYTQAELDKIQNEKQRLWLIHQKKTSVGATILRNKRRVAAQADCWSNTAFA